MCMIRINFECSSTDILDIIDGLVDTELDQYQFMDFDTRMCLLDTIHKLIEKVKKDGKVEKRI